MTRKLIDDSSKRAMLDFTAMFEALSPEYRDSIVIRALRARDHVSTDAGRSLDSAIRGSIRMVGYSNPALAISSALLEPVSSVIGKSEKLATATLRVWAESLDELEQLVSGHLQSEGLPAEYPDFVNSRFRGFWDENSWQKEMDWIIDMSEVWSEEDIALMLCYVSGRTILIDDVPPAPEADDEPIFEVSTARYKQGPVEIEPAAKPEEIAEPAPVQAQPGVAKPVDRVSPSILTQCIEYLNSLSPEDLNWNEVIPEFQESVNSIKSIKASQRERRAGLESVHKEIAQEFAADLEFLEQDTSFWSAQNLTELSELDRALEQAASLKRLLLEYQDVRRPGGTLTEELGRRERRFALEPRILDTVDMIRRIMTEKTNSGDSFGFPGANRR